MIVHVVGGYAAPEVKEGGSIRVRLQCHHGEFALLIPATVAAPLARDFLRLIGYPEEKSPEPKVHPVIPTSDAERAGLNSELLLSSCRAARDDVTVRRMTINEAAATRGLDPDLLERWLAKLLAPGSAR